MATHTAPDDLLADYASGAATPGVSLLVAAHLSQVVESRARVETFESVAGSIFANQQGEEMRDDALASVMAMLDEDAPAQPANSRHAAGPLPSCVIDAIGVDFDEIPWKFQLPGVSAMELDGFEGETVTLLRAKPGARIPQHTHEGAELTLVLQGCLSDGGIEYRRGDIAVNDEHDDHRPEITGGEVCYCLSVQEGPVRFTGRFSRVLNYLGE